MKYALALLLALSFACTHEEEYPMPPTKKDKHVMLRFGDYNWTNSSARSASDFNHVLSNSTVAMIKAESTTGEVENAEITCMFNEINAVTLTLKEGAEYVVSVRYKRLFADGTKKKFDNGLAFDALSKPTVITDSTYLVELSCSTDQSLILIDKEQADTTFVARFSDGSIKDDGSPLAFQMFESEFFWYLYLELEEGDRLVLQYKIIDRGIKSIELVGKLQPMRPYLISAVERGTLELSYDYDDMFGDLIVIGI